MASDTVVNARERGRVVLKGLDTELQPLRDLGT